MTLWDSLKNYALHHYWQGAIFCSGLIFLLSSFPAPSPPVEIPFYDKAAHLGLFLMLGWTYLNAATRGFVQRTGRRYALAWAASILYGAFDEFHQAFIPGRFPDWGDWYADAAGGTLALLFVWCYFRRRNDS